MVQTIITYIIVGTALFFAIYKIVGKRHLFSQKNKKLSCNTCSESGCDGCPLAELKKDKLPG